MIAADQIDRVMRLMEGKVLDETLVIGLRTTFPDLHFTYCMDDDVTAAEPVREGEGFNLYLVDGSNHCFCFTQDPDKATGLVLAETEDEE